jgi:hypothetical protein
MDFYLNFNIDVRPGLYIEDEIPAISEDCQFIPSVPMDGGIYRMQTLEEMENSTG